MIFPSKKESEKKLSKLKVCCKQNGVNNNNSNNS